MVVEDLHKSPMNKKNELKEILKERDDWTTKEIRKLINDKYDVEFSEKHV